MGRLLHALAQVQLQALALLVPPYRSLVPGPRSTILVVVVLVPAYTCVCDRQRSRLRQGCETCVSKHVLCDIECGVDQIECGVD
eukprot:2473334-Rhodomonas_salina.1